MKSFIAIILVSLASLVVVAQEPSYLPPTAVNIIRTFGGPPNSMFSLFEQRGWVPYKGVGCDDASTAFEEGADGKRYGNNEYVEVYVLIQHYKPDGKFTFDLIMQNALPQGELKEYKESAKGNIPDGVIRTVTEKDVNNGKMIIKVDRSGCIMSQHSETTTIYFKSYAIIGATLVGIRAFYYSTDATFAEKLHNEVVGQIKKIGFK